MSGDETIVGTLDVSANPVLSDASALANLSQANNLAFENNALSAKRAGLVELC